MNTIKRLITEEPVLLVGFVEALIVLLMAFGLGLTPEQMASILAFVNVALALAARAVVTPVAKLRQDG